MSTIISGWIGSNLRSCRDKRSKEKNVKCGSESKEESSQFHSAVLVYVLCAVDDENGQGQWESWHEMRVFLRIGHSIGQTKTDIGLILCTGCVYGWKYNMYYCLQIVERLIQSCVAS
jgi:hypothetical protein